MGTLPAEPFMIPVDLHEIAKPTQYPADAFDFVRRGLDYTVRQIHGEEEPALPMTDEEVMDEAQSSRHVSGQQLCRGLRDYAVSEYGLLAKAVLDRWNVRQCTDFGQIVYAMVDSGLLRKNDGDSLRDFEGVFDFQTAFHYPKPLLEESDV
jgi:uncharacterized repeat protein (TIGR04138 family)